MPMPVSLTWMRAVAPTRSSTTLTRPSPRELERVGQEIDDDLLQAQAIAEDGARRGIDRGLDHQALGVGVALTEATASSTTLTSSSGRRSSCSLPPDARDVEQVVDELGLQPRVALDDLQRALGLIAGERPLRSIRTQPSIAVSGVRSSCESWPELVLGAVGALPPRRGPPAAWPAAARCGWPPPRVGQAQQHGSVAVAEGRAVRL